MKNLTIINKSRVLLCIFVLGIILSNSFTSNAALKSETAPYLTKYVGDAIDIFPNTFKSTALQNKSAERLAGNSSCKTYYDIIETSEELENFYENTIKANLKVAGTGVTADGSFEKYINNHTKINSNTVSLVVMVLYDGPVVSLSNAEFTDYAKQLIKAKNIDTFYRLYGNSYVRTSHLGGILFLSYSAEITSESNLTKETVKTALNTKYKVLSGGASDDETKKCNKILNKTRITGYSYDTMDLISNDVVDTKEKYKLKVQEFANYYNSIVLGEQAAGAENDTSKLDYYVVGRELAPYYNVIGSGYNDPSSFPKYYDITKFETKSIKINNPSKQPNNALNKITVSWTDICNYETGYKIYIKTPNMSYYKLVKTVSANTTKTSVNISSSDCKAGYDLRVVPYKDSYEGRCVNPKHISPNKYHGSKLKAGESLVKGEYLESENGRYRLCFQEDSNLVIYDTTNWRALWASNTWNKPVTYCRMTSSSLEIIDSTSKVYFVAKRESSRSSRVRSSRVTSSRSVSSTASRTTSARTTDTRQSFAVMQNNGCLELYYKDQSIWVSDSKL